jgi:hypothetical protein
MKFKKLNIIQLKHTSEMGQPSQVHFQQNDLRKTLTKTLFLITSYQNQRKKKAKIKFHMIKTT